MEHWKTIKSIPGYEVSSEGNCRRIGDNKNKKLSVFKNGYKYGNFIIDGKHKILTIHRIVANEFIENTYNKPCVNHIDGNKINNDISNLEWCTYSENNTHKIRVLGFGVPWDGKKGADCYNSKTVFQYDLEGNFIREFGSGHEVTRELGFHQTGISKCCLGKIKNFKGFYWSYKKN